MKKSEVKVGSIYKAKVTNKVVSVRIDSTNTHGGWNATNLSTNKKVRIKSAQRLRGRVTDNKKPAAPSPRKTAARPRKDKATRRLSALDAAATVLQAADKPMRTRDLVAAMTEKGLWSSPNGKTPQATLYAAMVREIKAKGSEARFRKVDRGLFAPGKESR